jgi:glycerol-3-phosphate responsive antiterminator
MENVMSNENQRPTQCQKILRHLNDYGKISSLEAVLEYGIMRLASRMHELKKRGIEFTVELVNGLNRYQEPVRYAVYSIKGD